MKNALKKLMMIVLAMAVLAGIYSIAFAEETAAVTEEASISIGRVSKDEVYYGDQVTLQAYVKNISGDYMIVWEQLKDGQWIRVGSGSQYTFTVTEATAAAEFRAVLVIPD